VARRYLVLAGDAARGFELTTAAEARTAIKIAALRPCRVSPIFRAVPEAGDGDPLVNCSWVAFFCPRRAFEFIGEQTQRTQERLWFSHGLAAVIQFAQTKEELLETLARQEEKMAAYEIWQLSNGRVTVVDLWVREATPPQCDLEDYSDLSKDGRRLLEEIQVNLHEAALCAAIYMPEQGPKLDRITASVNEILRELRTLERVEVPAAAPQSEADSGQKVVENETDAAAPKNGADTDRHQRINQRLSHLIQLNSALAYVVSQTSNGSVPILERPCLVATYSLLGVGTAYRAVSAVAGYVEDIFERHAVLPVIDDFYRKVKGFHPPRSLPHYNVEDLRKADLSIDTFLSGQSEESRPKLAFFSLRLGFGEAHFSVTAAAQVLHAADSVRWSLMTLTHELLHSHVTGLLSTIFCEGVAEGLTKERFQQYHEDYKAYLSSPVDAVAPPKLLAALRSMIFIFAAYRHNAYETAKTLTPAATQAKLSGKTPDSPELFRSFYGHSLRLLEELLVHTLDIRYFYRGDRDLFLELLWESWTTVPAVVGDLETYLLRSLVAVATLEEGRVALRFKLSSERLVKKLGELSTKQPHNAFLKKAVRHLEDKNNSRRLRVLFYPAIYIADMAATFLCSQKIEASLWSGDPNIEPGAHPLPDYALDFGVFRGGRVSNPIPLLATRLRAGTNGDHDHEDYRSAWLLLATASAASPQT